MRRFYGDLRLFHASEPQFLHLVNGVIFFKLINFGYTGSSLPRTSCGTLRHNAQAYLTTEHRLEAQSLSRRGTRAQLGLVGLVVPRPVESSQTRDRTRVPCLIHCTTRKSPMGSYYTTNCETERTALFFYFHFCFVFQATRYRGTPSKGFVFPLTALCLRPPTPTAFILSPLP